MKYIEEFRNNEFAHLLAYRIQADSDPARHYQLMEFCGGHTHTIHRYGLPSLLPKNVEMIHGPGCPVCVLPMTRIDQAIKLATIDQVILCSYGDMLRVPGSNRFTLLNAKAEGADVRMIYAIHDALQIAKDNPQKQVVFFAIGFETTTPATAHAIIKAKEFHLKNFTVFCNHVLTPAAMHSLLKAEIKEKDHAITLDGLIGPAHVSIVIGSNAYELLSKTYNKPIVIAGFEPLDVLHAIHMLIQQINDHRSQVEIQYTRAVIPSGNIISQQIIAEIFEPCSSFEWRGLGVIPNSALKIREKYAEFDAEQHFTLPVTSAVDHKQCECSAVLRGVKKPTACKLFATVCTPDQPIGSCMVSAEGACAAVYAYGRLNP